MPTLDLSTLPASIQQALLDLYEFLQQKHANKFVNPVVPASKQQLGQADFIQNLYVNIPKMEGCVRATTA